MAKSSRLTSTVTTYLCPILDLCSATTLSVSSFKTNTERTALACTPSLISRTVCNIFTLSLKPTIVILFSLLSTSLTWRPFGTSAPSSRKTGVWSQTSTRSRINLVKTGWIAPQSRWKLSLETSLSLSLKLLFSENQTAFLHIFSL